MKVVRVFYVFVLLLLMYSPARAQTIQPYAGAPLCTTHDDRAFHTLWNASLGCHYNHEHHDDPHSVDYLLGTQIYQWAGGEISYPWQTFSAAGHENHLKHQGYKWLAVDNSSWCNANTALPCIRAFRAQVHAVSGLMDAVVRYHSYWLEAELCKPAADTFPAMCGTFRRGGWLDFGHLNLDNVYVPLASDPPIIDPVPVRLHFIRDAGEIARGVQAQFNWYGVPRNPDTTKAANGSFNFVLGLKSEDFTGNLVITNTTTYTQTFYGGAYNGSTMEGPHQLGMQLTLRTDRLDGVVDGKVDLSGYLDRYGNFASGCSTISVDCVPFEYNNLPIVNYLLRGPNIHPLYEYDITPAGEPQSWISFPN